jgi:hypothetical protein
MMSVIMLNADMLSAIMPSVIMLSVIILNVVMLGVDILNDVAPFYFGFVLNVELPDLHPSLLFIQ